MNSKLSTVITGTGAFLPKNKITNNHFLNHIFHDANHHPLPNSPQDIVNKFVKITSITERLYADDNMTASDLGALAAEDAFHSSGIDREGLEYIIVAHNFGDVKKGSYRTDIVPSLASRIKHLLGIQNPNCIPYDLPFGCPGWLQGVIQANYFIKSGDAKRILVIGTETISRVIDPHDRDGMIYSDGAGAVILEAKESTEKQGILAHSMRSDTNEHVRFLWMGESNKTIENDRDIYLKMDGKKLYEYALNTVPLVVNDCIQKSGVPFDRIKKVLMHQANAKMNEAILKRVFSQNGESELPEGFMPMIISWMGNNSVATIPILLDMILKGNLEGQTIHPGDHILFASVGAGMNINSVVYKF